MKRKAFTLIELLTVMAITAVMLTLIVLPLFQSFQITRSAQALADAQDKGRGLIAQIAKEIGNAVSVRSASNTIAQLPAIDSVTRQPKNDGTLDDNILPYSKLDLVPPAQGTPDPTLATGTFRDPDTGKIDPTLTRPKGDINLNIVPGQTLVRYWIGLRDPSFDPITGKSKLYNEPYTGLLMARNGGRDNLFVLRRAEVQPFVYRPIKTKSQKRPYNTSDATLQLAWRPNLDYFRSDDVTDTRIIDLDDPYFFIADGQYLPEPITGQPAPTRQADPGNPSLEVPGKNERVAHWAGLGLQLDNKTAFSDSDAPRTGESVIQTDVSRYDMIRPIVVGSPPQVDKNAPVTARVVPLIQFRPTRVAAEPAAGSAAARPGEAVEGIDRIGPDTYKTDRGLWSNAFVRYYPGTFAPTTSAVNMEVANVNPLGVSVIEAGVASGSGFDTGDNTTLFDLNAYERGLAGASAYPFTYATNISALGDDAHRSVFTPFRVMTGPGKIVTSFPIEQVGGAGSLPSGVSINLPIVNVAVSASPVGNSGNGAISPYSGTGAQPNANYDPNQAFNYLWNTYPELQGNLQRFIDLRFVPNADGTLSPLCPLPMSTTGASQITGFTLPDATGSTTNRVRIVPGSDEVYGPDQTPSVSGSTGTVRYTRVTGNPGPNQYRLVYADLAEPTNTSGNVDYSVLGLSSTLTGAGGTFDPTTYNPSNPVSVAIQSRFKAGYLQLESDPNLPLPVGAITVKYRFQFSGPSDTFAVDLDTREVMQILLTVKNYPQSSAPNAQTVTLKATATLRNALR